MQNNMGPRLSEAPPGGIGSNWMVQQRLLGGMCGLPAPGLMLPQRIGLRGLGIMPGMRVMPAVGLDMMPGMDLGSREPPEVQAARAKGLADIAAKKEELKKAQLQAQVDKVNEVNKRALAVLDAAMPKVKGGKGDKEDR